MEFGIPEGFVIERLNPADKRDSYVVLTFDSQGRPVVSKENDFPRRLIDADGDGIYESEQVITEKIRNAHGLWFDGNAMYAVANAALTPEEAAREQAELQAQPTGARNPGIRGSLITGGRGTTSPMQSGLFRVDDTNGDGAAETFTRISRLVGVIEEHGGHGLRRGPDGHVYYMSGNNAGTPTDDLLDENSLILATREDQFLPALDNFGTSQRDGVHSAVYRLDLTTRKFSLFTGANRNAYDLSFNLAGEMFYYDSDMEPEIGVPWYREVRTVHGVLGGSYGYRNGSGKFPPYYIDSLPPLRDLGRGSPVGVENYQHHAFPAEYHDALLEADWSRGRVLFTALTPAGGTYTVRDDRAEIIHGEPLNVTDLEVGPDGALYFTTGGRMTAGGFWRLRYTGNVPTAPGREGILAVVRQPQPLSSWGWASIAAVKARLGAEAFGAQLEQLARDSAGAPLDRARAVYELVRHGPAPSDALLRALVSDRNPDVRAAAVYAAGIKGRDIGVEVASAALKDTEAMVRRRGAEAFLRIGQRPDRPSLAPIDSLYALLNDSDRFVRWSARLVIERTRKADWAGRVLSESNPVGALEGMVALVHLASPEDNLEPLIERQIALLRTGNLSTDDRLRLLRTYGLTTTRMPSGVRPELRKAFYDLTAPAFPAADERLNRELALTMAYNAQADTVGRIWSAMPQGNDNQPLQIHYVYALRTIKQGWTAAQKQELVDWFAKAVKWRGGNSNFSFYSQMFAQSMDVFSGEERQLASEKLPQFPRPGQPQVAAGPGGGGGGPANSPGLTREELYNQLIFVPERGAVPPGAGGPGGPGGGGGGGRGGQPPVNAAAVFEQHCASCHAINGAGGRYAPDLTNRSLSRREMVEALLYPSRKVDERYHTTVIRTNDGRTVRGLVAEETDAMLSLKTAASADLVAVPKASIVTRTREATSIMPDELFERLNQNQFSALIRLIQNPQP